MLTVEQREYLQKELDLRVNERRQDTLLALCVLFPNGIDRGDPMSEAKGEHETVAMICDRLNAIDDVVERNRIGYSLFGTLYEDIG